MIRKCLVCNKDFQVKLSKVKLGCGKFCSQRCMGKWMSKNLKGKNNRKWHGIEKKCIKCRKTFFTTPYRIKEGHGKFCSKICHNKWMSKNLSGKNSIHWRGGITTIVKIRNSLKYKLWRQQIFIRDNFTCQKCGIKGCYLEAHHKKSFHKLIEDVKKYLPLLNLYEGAMIYTPLWNIENGITLCQKCHKKI